MPGGFRFHNSSIKRQPFEDIQMIANPVPACY